MSSGGCLAYELAVQLLAAGVAVFGLIAIDRDPFDMRAPLFVAPAAPTTTTTTTTTTITANAPTNDAATASTFATSLAAAAATNAMPPPPPVASREQELAERLATLDRCNEASGKPLTEAALIDALASGGGRVLMEGEALQRFAHRYVASHRLTATYVPSIPVQDLLQRAGSSLRALTLFKAEGTPPTALRPGVVRREVADCHHFTILATPGFVAGFVEEACTAAAACM